LKNSFQVTMHYWLYRNHWRNGWKCLDTVSSFIPQYCSVEKIRLKSYKCIICIIYTSITKANSQQTHFRKTQK